MNLADNEVEDLLGEGDNDTTRKSQEAVGSLRGIVGLERKTDLHNTEAEQDKTDGSDQPEDKAGQIVDDRNGVAGSERRNGSAEDECRTHNDGAVDAEAFSDLAGHRQLSGMLLGVLLKDVHMCYLHKFS